MATTVQRKVRRYANILEELQAAGIVFRPMAWSAEGRPHPAVLRILAAISERVARKRPGSTAQQICQRLRQEVGTALARRLARIIHSCMPRDNGQAAAIVLGRIPTG